MRTDTPQPIRLKDYKPSNYLIDHTSLDFRLAPDNTRVITRLDCRANPAAGDGDRALVLDGEQLRLHSIAFTGVPLSEDEYRVTKDQLIIPNPPQQPFTLELETSCDPTANTALSGLYRSSGNYCTQCEAEGFRRITYSLDRPDILSRYRVRIEAEKADCPVLLSNGNKVLSGDCEDPSRHFAIWEDPFPKPSYLFALVAGDLACVKDRFTTMYGREIALEIYVEHGKQDRCDWAMTSLKNSMAWDERRFGREYDLDVFMIVAVSDFNMGAMENKGLNIFNDKYILARPETATDLDYAHIESIIAHEYFHNWSGNRVTCRDWFQLCLKEGLTVFRDQEFSADLRSRPVKRISDVKLLRGHQFPEDAGPLAHPVRPQSYVEINNFYTATVYEKGAEIVRMLQTLIGKDDFRKAMDIYFSRYDGQAATVEDFVGCMAEASGRDLSQFFLWYEQAGTPDVFVQSQYDEAEGTFQLTLSQSTKPTPGQDIKKPLHIPLRLGLIDRCGKDIDLTDAVEWPGQPHVVELTEAEQVFVFKGLNERPVLSLNRGFSAPIKLVSDVSDEEKLFLIGHDSDAFNRFEACQEIGMDIILAQVSDPDARPDKLDGLIAALQKTLDDATLEPAFKAQMITMPDEGSIASQVAHDVDPEKIHNARQSVTAALGRGLNARLQEIYNQPRQTAYQPDEASAGQRALAQACLLLIASADNQLGAQLAYEQFTNATNMTDEYNGLIVLSQLDVAERGSAFDAFYQAHKDDHLLVDKWFALQAQVPYPETLGLVRSLMNHEAFSLNKPNTVRALIGSFAMANPVCFNEPDGSGYELFGEVILDLDKINPQVAARLASALRSWRMLEPERRQAAKQVLEHIHQTDGLSKDTFDIVDRSLGSAGAKP